MLTRHLTSKILDIRIEEEKFYFPGETIKGIIVVHPKSSIKVNSIQLKFFGEVYIHLKEKETTTLFQNSLVLSVYPNSTVPKQTTLSSSEHEFPFQFIVPKDLNLPSSMELGKKGHIRYTIHAMLDRPMIPEPLCPKIDYTVSLLEFIDIEQKQFKIPQEKSQDVMLPDAKYNQKCMVTASIPRLGFTRGDIVPLKVIIDHFTSFSRKGCVTVNLVRTVEIRTSHHTVFKETVLRSTQYDVDIKQSPYQQSLKCQILIPTSTPPSIRYKEKVLRFHYKVHVEVSFTSKVTITLDIPVVIGTWPRASVPIEDDEDTTHDLEDLDDDIESVHNSVEGRWHKNNSSSTLNTAYRNSISSNNMNRSDSITSRTSNNSTSSWKSSRSWEMQKMNPSKNLSRNTSQSTTLSSPDRLPSYYTHHRSSSSLYSYSSCEYPSYNYQQRQSNTLPPLAGPIHPQSYRLGRYEPPIILHNDVPTHILEPIASVEQQQQQQQQQQQPEISILSDSSSESLSLEDSDEDDLLAIIERKKRKNKES
ncbi:uncharacterized protein BX663DRAFT_552272 [Cokeromyces recurvatus]|uniref:uncharacterized protein n=1 Tax=Cokeromyces recurvatus TaxID=90255 RepID=UPI00221FD08C|nr:uncharacterized protein BX663DRAFT_552272 [Cokeromyces recurvatus]KAI7902341.1 hypothetical protein BX663DRAFT_552272 [Cokeromyces recurvatus]